MIFIVILIFFIGMCCGIKIDQYVNKSKNITQVNTAENVTQIGIVETDNN